MTAEAREPLYPLERTNDRALPPDYVGPIDVWDIDKTYLVSDIESVGGLVRGALAAAIDRRPVPGTVALLEALRRRGAMGLRAPLYFVSASPPELRSRLEKRMLMDGVEFDGIAFKDYFALLRRRRFREMRRHVAYKLAALLAYRGEWPDGGREWLFGDDAEADALIYWIYAGLRAGTLRGVELDRALRDAGVAEKDRARIVRAAGPLPACDSVEGIYIFQVAKTPPLDLARFAPRVVAVKDPADAARDLANRGRLTADDVERVSAGLAADLARARSP
jgi:hypothetical protein